MIGGLLIASPTAQAASSTVGRTCKPRPRGNGGAALIYDTATGVFLARGAVDPAAGHVISIVSVALLRCYGPCTAYGAVNTPTMASGSYQVKYSPAVAGSLCYRWQAYIGYEVDRRDSYNAFTEYYGGLC